MNAAFPNQEQDNSKPVGDLKDFEALFKQYYAPLVVYAAKYVGEVETAREIVQDFFVKLYEKREMIRVDTSLKSYLFRSVYNSCINYINQRAIQDKHLKNIDLEKDNEENLEDEINTLELQQKIFSLIELLPARCKKIFKMNRLEGLKNEEIASKLNLSKRTVETQISKALKILRKKLKDYPLILTIPALLVAANLIQSVRF